MLDQTRMPRFATLEDLRNACRDLWPGDADAAQAVAARQAQLTKPPGSLGRLEDIAGWLAIWQGRAMPRLETVEVLVFAGNHGVVAQGVSAYPAVVTGQMVANFAAGGAAINQLSRLGGARLKVVPLELDRPTGDFTRGANEAHAIKGVAANMGLVKVAEQGSELMRLADWQIRNEWRQRIAMLNAALTQGRDALAARQQARGNLRDGGGEPG